MAAKTADDLSKLALNGANEKADNPSIAGKQNGTNGNLSADDDSEDDETQAPTAAKKKKKRKPKKKKAAPKEQSDPPRVKLSHLWPKGDYPAGEEVEYKDDNAYRTTSEEKRHLDRMKTEWLSDYRQSAEVHRQVRQWAHKHVKPGMSLTEIAEGIEEGTRALTGHPGL